MAHELHIKNGTASMAYVGARPWHGLGQELTAGASIDTWVKEAGMDYELLSSPVAYQDATGTPRQFPGRQIFYRSDDGAPLGLVGDRYKIVQPREVVEFFRSLAEDHGFELETAGVLFGGKKYWALARTPESFKVGKKDEVRGHLMLATACDGSMSTVAKYVATRVVCNNTLGVALGEGKAGQVKVRHNTNFQADVVKEELGLYKEAWDKFKDQVFALASRKMSQQETVSYLIKLVGDPSKAIEEQPNVETMQAIAEKFVTQNYIGHEMSGDSAWGLVSCVTEYYDHSRGRDQSRRLEHAWFGGGMDLKVKAMEVAMAYV